MLSTNPSRFYWSCLALGPSTESLGLGWVPEARVLNWKQSTCQNSSWEGKAVSDGKYLIGSWDLCKQNGFDPIWGGFVFYCSLSKRRWKGWMKKWGSLVRVPTLGVCALPALPPTPPPSLQISLCCPLMHKGVLWGISKGSWVMHHSWCKVKIALEHKSGVA